MNFSLHKITFKYWRLFLSIAFATVLLAFRIKLTHTFFYSFLVWNLFLAALPYLISQAMLEIKMEGRWKVLRFFGFGLWLLFLPNSPYIITDLIHLHNEKSQLLWYDLFLVFVFALNGLLLGLLSMLDMYRMFRSRFSNKIAHYSLFKICLLCGFGIYLGRFLRFNSWDIFTKPALLFSEMAAAVYHPYLWLMTFGFGGFLWSIFLLVLSITEKN